MSGIGAWRPLMRQSVSIAPRASENQRGNPTYGTAVNYRCLIEGKQRQVVNAQGRQVISSQTLYLASGDNVLPDAQVTFSTGDVGSTESWAVNPPIVATGRFFDERGALITVVHLQ